MSRAPSLPWGNRFRRVPKSLTRQWLSRGSAQRVVILKCCARGWRGGTGASQRPSPGTGRHQRVWPQGAPSRLGLGPGAPEGRLGARGRLGSGPALRKLTPILCANSDVLNQVNETLQCVLSSYLDKYSPLTTWGSTLEFRLIRWESRAGSAPNLLWRPGPGGRTGAAPRPHGRDRRAGPGPRREGARRLGGPSPSAEPRSPRANFLEESAPGTPHFWSGWSSASPS